MLTERSVCPSCGSDDTTRAQYWEYRHLTFVVRPPYRCRACGILFDVPGGAALPLAGAVILAGFAVLGAFGLVADICAADARAAWRTAIALTGDVVTIAVMLWWAFICVETARRALRTTRQRQ